MKVKSAPAASLRCMLTSLSSLAHGRSGWRWKKMTMRPKKRSTGLSPKKRVEKPREKSESAETRPAPWPRTAVAMRPPSSRPMGSSCSALRSAEVKPMRASGWSSTTGPMALMSPRKMDASVLSSSDEVRRPAGMTGLDEATAAGVPGEMTSPAAPCDPTSPTGQKPHGLHPAAPLTRVESLPAHRYQRKPGGCELGELAMTT